MPSIFCPDRVVLKERLGQTGTKTLWMSTSATVQDPFIIIHERQLVLKETYRMWNGPF